MVKVLFVCLGNICRSPTAEGAFTHLVQQQGLSDRIEIDSAGTADFHVGRPPDSRAQAEALSRGIDISHLRGRQAVMADFETFDYVLAMDSENHRNLQRICPSGQDHKLKMFLDYAPNVSRRDVPDPYYEGGFGSVYDMLEEAAGGLLEEIKANHL